VFLLTESCVADVERFYADHRDGVYRYLRRVVGDAEPARDLTQEVFLRVSKAGVPDASDIGRRAWLFRIARNLALNYLRDGRRRPVSVALGHHAVPATQELALALRDAIAQLAELDRDVFVLRESAGLSYDEIAAACEIPLESVRARLHRARQALRAELGQSLRIREQRGVRMERVPRDGRTEE
jgi:RNA polymerase sigma-70 factor (ECF subfamily)